jgi:PAS domain S-box-containing protein
MKKTSTTYFLLFAGVLSLSIFSLLFYKRIRLLMHSYELVNRSTQVYLQSERLFLSLRDATVEYHNYLRTYDTAYIADFKEKLNEYSQILILVNQLELENKRQQKNIQQVNKLSQEYISRMKQDIASSKIDPPGEIDFANDRRMLERVRESVNLIINTEIEIRKRRDEELSRHIYTTPIFLLVFSFISLAAIIYAFFSIVKQIKKSRILELSEAKFRLLIKQAPVAIAIFKGEDAIVEIINDKALSILDKKSTEITGRSLFDAVPGTIKIKEMYDKVLTDGRPVTSSEFLVPVFRNGKLEDCYFDFVIEPLFNNDSKIISAMAVATETTETIVAYKKVQESEKQFRALIENSLDVIILADAEGALSYCSPSVKNIFGYDETELIGRMAISLVHPDDTAPLVESAAPMVEGRHKVFNTVRFLHKDGSWRWVESTIANLLGVPYVNAFVCNVHDITEQKNAQDTLKQSEANFRQLADLIPQIVWTAKTDGSVDYYNKRWYEYTRSEEIYEDQNWIAVIHPDDAKRSLDTWLYSVATGEPYRIEYRFNDRNSPNDYRWFLGKALPIRNEEGTIIKWFGTCTDIHDQKTITEKLEQLVKERTAELTVRNKDLSEAQGLAHIGSWEWDIKENKIYWSDELYRVYGIKPGAFEATYEKYLELLYPEDRDYVNKIITEAFENKDAFDFYHRLVRPDGSVRTLHARGKVYTDGENNPVRMKGTGQDISQTIAIQNKINNLNQTFNFAEQTSFIGSFRYNFSTGEFSNSDNLYRLLGCTPGEFEPIYDNFKAFIHPEDLENVLAEIQLLDETSSSIDYLFRVIKKDGSVIHVRNTGIFITEHKERIYIGALQDITVQHNKELQLLEQNTTLEKMNNELASFSYIASHDLQEPLRKIRMFTRRLMEKEVAALSNDGVEYFNRIDNAATRMQQLIDDLLSYSRTNTVQAHFELVSIDKLLEEVTDNLKEKILQTNTIIEYAELETAWVIPFQFQQLFTNLITNSIKFTHKGIAPHILISHKIITGSKNGYPAGLRNEKYHVYNITDNGIGFESQYSEQIFGLFQRLHGRNEFEGTGIGLAICKKIIENHNGIITATSKLDAGATFNIYVPVEQVK